jgi:hypothetical protein
VGDKKNIEMRKFKEQEELSKCTFKPMLNEQKEQVSNVEKVLESFMNN